MILPSVGLRDQRAKVAVAARAASRPAASVATWLQVDFGVSTRILVVVTKYIGTSTG